MMTVHGYRRVRHLASTAVLCLALACAGADEPFDAVLKRQDMVTKADESVMAYVCDEAQHRQLAATEPLRSAIAFVEHGKQLEGWATELSYPATPTPARFAGPIDSLRSAIDTLARSFAPAVASAPAQERECFGEYALRCNQVVHARIILSRIDRPALEQGRAAYFRHRAVVAGLLADAGAPLGTLRRCGR